MQLDVISDTVCPWCYIGKKRLDEALAMRPDLPITLQWRPFQLDPNIPPEGVDRQTYMERKFGKEKLASAGNAIRDMGAEVGIDFAFDKIKRSPNTLDSHRLIRWAGSAGCQNEVVELLFQRYFIEGGDLGDHEVLIDVAATAGMDADLVRELLRGDADRKLVEYDDYVARQMGVQGVPCFIFNQKHVAVGAQDAAKLVRAFDTLCAEEAEAAAASAE